jgi:hypothetical protein
MPRPNYKLSNHEVLTHFRRRQEDRLAELEAQHWASVCRWVLLGIGATFLGLIIYL